MAQISRSDMMYWYSRREQLHHPNYCLPMSMAEWSNNVLKTALYPQHLSFHNVPTKNLNYIEPLLEDDSHGEVIDLTLETCDDNDFEADVLGIEEDVANKNIDHETPVNKPENVESEVEPLVPSSPDQTTSRSKRPVKPVNKDIPEWYPRANTFTWGKMQDFYQNQLVKIYSSIDHFGVTCKVDIPKGQYIVEYVGKKIPTFYVDYQEKLYESQGIFKDYMYTIDEDITLDATDDNYANIAKYCNHSCEPNSKSVVVKLNNEIHVVISAIKKIAAGEEITWFYNLPLANAKNGERKIPCKCGTGKCKRFMN